MIVGVARSTLCLELQVSSDNNYDAIQHWLVFA